MVYCYCLFVLLRVMLFPTAPINMSNFLTSEGGTVRSWTVRALERWKLTHLHTSTMAHVNSVTFKLITSLTSEVRKLDVVSNSCTSNSSNYVGLLFF